MRVVITYYDTRIAPGGSDTTTSDPSDRRRLCHSTASFTAVAAFETRTPTHTIVNGAIAVAPAITSTTASPSGG
jgi:hypothetical protein